MITKEPEEEEEKEEEIVAIHALRTPRSIFFFFPPFFLQMRENEASRGGRRNRRSLRKIPCLRWRLNNGKEEGRGILPGFGNVVAATKEANVEKKGGKKYYARKLFRFLRPTVQEDRMVYQSRKKIRSKRYYYKYASDRKKEEPLPNN